MTKKRIWIDGHITECNLCGDKFIIDQTMFDAKVIGGAWGYLCLKCQKTRTTAGLLYGREESGCCIKYIYRPYRKEE